MSKNWQAQIYIKWNKNWPSNWAGKKTWDWLKEWPEVKQAWSAMGEWDLILVVDTHSPDEIENFVCEKLMSRNWVEKTETHWVRQVWQAA